MSAFNSKVKGLNRDISEFSNKINGFNHGDQSKLMNNQPASASKGKASDLAGQETGRRAKQESLKVDGDKGDADKQVQILQTQLIRAKKEHLAQINRLQAELDRCKSEKLALSKSLDSSERIRQQQKTLISLLQQGTHTGIVENVPEDNSLTPSILADNCQWLNPSNKESASIVSGLSETGSEGSGLNRRRKKGRKAAAAAGAGGNGVAFRSGSRGTISAPFPRGSGQPPVKPPLRNGNRAITPRTRRAGGANTDSRSPTEGPETGSTVDSASLVQRQRDYSAQLAYGRQKATTLTAASPARKNTAAASSTPSRAPASARTTRAGADTPSPSRRGPRAPRAAPGTPSSVQRCTFGSR